MQEQVLLLDSKANKEGQIKKLLQSFPLKISQS
jgi:hypothetical protein